MDSWILSPLGSMKWDVNEFSSYFVVTAPFGHYIALVPRDENEMRDLTIYDGCGKVVVEDVLSPSYHVIGSHWLEDQRLCVFLNDCRVLVYTVTSDPRRMIELFTEEEIDAGIKIKEAYTCGLTCCLISDTNDIYFVSEIIETKARKAPSLPEDVRKSDIKVLGMLHGTCIGSRNTSVVISVLSGPFKGILFVVCDNSSDTHILIEPLSDAITNFGLHPYHALSAYCSEKTLLVYDNDCKYNLFKCSFVKEEEKVATPHSPVEEVEAATPQSTESSLELRISRQLSRLGLRAPSSRSINSAADSTAQSTQDVPSPVNSNPSSPKEVPPIPHQVYGLYWLNDNSVAVILSDRYNESKCRILALTIHGGFDWISLDYAPSHCIFQQEVDGLKIITPKSMFLLRQNHSRALIIPFHLQLAKRYSLYPDFFIHVYNEYMQGNEAITSEYAEIPSDMYIAVIQQLLSYCEWDNFSPQNTELLAALKLAIRLLPNPSHVHQLCNALYFTCCNVKVLNNLRLEGMPMTMKEFQDLSFPVVISRLLLQNKHIVALRICDVYNSHSNKQYQQENDNYFDKFRGIITMDWATKKIQSSTESSEQLATTVFTNILKIGRVPIIPIILNIYDIRPDLAISLLLLESNTNLAIACLLKINEYHEALRRADETHDPEVIFAVIRFAGDQLSSREEWFDLISESEAAVDLFFDYYSQMEYYDLLIEFMNHTAKYREEFYQLLFNANFDVDTLNKDSMFELDDVEKVEAKMFDLQRCVDLLLPGVNDFEVSCIKNQMTLFKLQIQLSASILNFSLYNTITNLLARRRDDSDRHAAYLKQQYAVTDVRYDILKLYGMAKAGCWEEIRQLYAARKNIIPIECFLQVVLARRAYNEGDYYLKVMNVKDSPALALHYALLLNQWTLATKLAVQLNDYSSIIIIMDSVGNDIPGIRMELFNYIRSSGYERESPFVNDVKFHPVLKAKKSFASGILAAFTSSDNSTNNLDFANDNTSEQQSNATETSTQSSTAGSIFNKFRKQVTMKLARSQIYTENMKEIVPRYSKFSNS